MAALQTVGTLRDVDANLAELTQAAEEASAGGAALLVTPEMFVTGYVVGERLPQLAAQDFLTPVRDLARRLGIAIVLGGPELTDSGVYNVAWFVDDRGEVVDRYRKSHLFGELDRRQFVAGDQLFGMAEVGGVKVATMICYDVEFPEVVRAAALAGAHVVTVPTAQMEPFAFVAEEVVRVRAWENQVYVAYVDHDGSEDDVIYVGRTSIVGPDGVVLASLERGTGLVYADIDPLRVESQQRANPYLADRRPSLYSALGQEPLG